MDTVETVGESDALSLVTWNVEWATPRSRRAPHLLERIDRQTPDVVCLTEAYQDLLPRGGYSICSQPDYRYPIRAGRRKVILRSQQPWHEVDDVGSDAMPPGRFVSGVTQTPVGHVTVIGVCIPWFGSRTEARRGNARKRRWEDHGRYLEALRQVLARTPHERVVVVGDFNQRLGPSSSAPAELRRALLAAFPPGMRIVTTDVTFGGHASIDHIALSADLAAAPISTLSNVRAGAKLSDHFGVAAHLRRR